MRPPRAGHARAGHARAGKTRAGGSRDARIVRHLVAWFDAARRNLPWRIERPGGGRDPYRVLVSEIMLQQTQVARVLEKFDAFLARFPDAEALARADLHDVLAAWSGLGYYRRARLLHAAARVIASHPGGLTPDLDDLKALPGVGRYTAGAIASIAFNQPAPIVDGNVARVLARLDADAKASATSPQTWTRATVLVTIAGAQAAAGRFNEGLMELGATVCTPRAPACGRCPLAGDCVAHANASQDCYPTPKPAAARRTIRVLCAAVYDSKGRLLVEQRPATGLWAGLWQMSAIEREQGPAPTRDQLAHALGLDHGTSWRRLGVVRVVLSHREVSLTLLAPRIPPSPRELRAMARGRRWVGAADLARLGISNAHQKAIAMAASASPVPTIA